MTINGIIDLDNGELLEATGKHRISALDIQGSETASFSFTFYQSGNAVTDNSVLNGAVIEFGVKADADFTGTSYKVYHNTFSASSDGLTYTATPTWATSEVDSALGNSSSVKLHGQVKIVISGITYYSQVFEVEIHNDVIQAAGETSSVIFPRLITSTSDPTVTDDIGDGYGVSSTWLNTSSNAVHVLIDNTEGAAVWAGFLALSNGAIATDLLLADNVKAIFGTASDGLEIYHSGSDSVIADTGTGDLIISSSDDIWFRTAGGNNYANFNSNGSVDLYYSNSKKFETTNTGATVTGKLVVSGDLDVDGTTTTFNSTVVTVDDPVFGIGGDTAPGSFDNKDRGVSFRYFRSGESAKVGFFGFDNSEDAFTFLTDTNDDSTEVFSGTLGTVNTGTLNITGVAKFLGGYVLDSAHSLRLDSASGQPVTISANDSEIARFTSTGLGIGGTATQKLSVIGGHIQMDNGYHLRLKDSGGTERTALQLSGNDLYLGTSSGGNLIFINGSSYTEAARFTSDGLFKIDNNNSGISGIDVDATAAAPLVWRTAGTLIGSLSYSGSDAVLRANAGGLHFQVNGSTEAARFDSDGHFLIPDNNKIKLGSSGELELFSDGTNRYIRSWGGDVRIENYAADKDVIFAADDGSGSAVETYFYLDGSEGLNRYNKPIHVGANTDGHDVKFFGNTTGRYMLWDESGDRLVLADSTYLALGTGSDALFYHTGSDCKLDNYVGDYYIRNLADDKDIIFQCDDGSGGVETYFYLNGSYADGSYTYTRWNDGGVITLGDARDLRLWHDPHTNNSYITNSTNDLIIRNYADDKNISFECDDGSGGVTEYFRCDGGYGGPGYPTTIFPDDSSLRFGNSGDLQIIYTAGASYISESTSDLHIRATATDKDIIFSASDGTLNELMRLDGSVGSIRIPDSVYLQIGSSNDLGIVFDGNNSIFSNVTGDLSFINYADNKDVIFYASSGSDAPSELMRLDGSASSVNIPDDVKLKLGSGSDMEISHASGNNWINCPAGGNLMIQSNGLSLRSTAQENYVSCTANGSVSLYYDAVKKFETTSTGVEVQDELKISTTGTATLTLNGDSNNVGDSGTTDSQIDFLHDFGNAHGYRISCQNFGGASSLTFAENIGGGQNTTFIIDENQNVGIGTDSPLAPIHIQGTALSGFESGDVATDTIAIIENDDNARLAIVAGTISDLLFGDADDIDAGRVRYYHSNNQMAFFTGGTERARLTSTGFGIGTDSPQKALEISAASTSGGGVMRLSSTGETSEDNVVGEIEFYNGDTSDYTPGVMASIKAIAGPSGGEGHLQFLTDMPSEGADASVVAMHISSTANVGINETSPASKCTVTGGDFETTTASKGVVLCSPNGTRYRLHINDDASVAVTAM